MVGPKIVMEIPCTADENEQKLTVLNDDGSIVNVPMPFLSMSIYLPEDNNFLFKTVPVPDTVSATPETDKKLEHTNVETFNSVISGLKNP